MQVLAILGAGGHGKVAADCAELSGWQEIHFYDDAWPEKSSVEHWPVHGNSRRLLARVGDYDAAFVAIGDGKRRKGKSDELKQCGFNLASLVHPSAVVSRYATLGEGSMVVGGAVINAFAHLGNGCVINTGATVGHDCVLGFGVHVAPGANIAGHVVIGDYSWIGIGAKIIQDIRVGADVTIGAGATVITHLPQGVTVVGTPARPSVRHQ
ncbi:acetyltransferase [Halomonas sp. ATCH28]|uniref:Acetyltransferase n=1 Tax=Halomonas gemina TaxID=2945105 RepID=A0ABT0T699_9GAMM|nr:acetyltransferase [Halomonas gemina]MCL7942308.1 acetyltransferase [Halomonas gemina]